MVYDAHDAYVLLFGGAGCSPFCGPFGDTWKFTPAGQWVELHPKSSPPARTEAPMAYDAADGYVVLFGGNTLVGGVTTLVNDTWTYAGGVWTQRHPAADPGPLHFPTMTYDGNATDQYVVLFGGYNASSFTESNATWKYLAGQWAELLPASAPPPRQGASLAYDGADGYVVLFGGFAFPSCCSFVVFGDTWKFHAGVWTDLSGSQARSPAARGFSALAFDPADSVLVLFGGLNPNIGASRADTWQFSGGLWSHIGPATVPRARSMAGMAPFGLAGGLVLFGGQGGIPNMEDTWGFHANVWKAFLPKAPSPRSYPAMVYDEADGYVVLFGGHPVGSLTPLADSWKFSHGSWARLHPAVSPPAREAAGIAYDQGDGYVVMYGGYNGSSYLNDTWKFFHGAWTLVNTGTFVPGPRAFASMTYDFADGYALLFGGTNGITVFNDSWTYSNGSWSQLLAAVAPGPRLGGAMTYDAADGQVLFFGGVDDNGASQSDTWTFLNDLWTNITASAGTPPSSRVYAGLVYDTFAGAVVLFGGAIYGVPSGLNDTWLFSAGTWSSTGLFGPFPRWALGFAYDAAPGDTYVVMVAGGGSPKYPRDTWLLEG